MEKKHEAGRHSRLCRNAKRAGRAGKRSADGDFREQHGAVSDPRTGQHFFRTPERELRKGDIVFYERPGGQFVVHRICGVHGESYDLIGDGQTEIEHNVRREQIFARVTQVERKGKRLAPGSFWWGFFEKIWIRMIPLRPMGNRIYRLLQGRRSAHRENEREKT